ncbi:MAG: hypothetical protein KH187_00240 [Collinsella sp.]|nr:hypothetical protein [Collinsella sp.]
MNKNFARLAVTAGLTAALSFGGVMAPVAMAFAEDATTTTNTITINKNKNNGDVKYKAYQIFKADVVDPTEEGATDKIVSNVKWAIDDSATQMAIINAIKEDPTYKTSNPKPDIVTAQDVADWLTKNVTGTTAETVVNKDHLLNKIAAIVKKDVKATGNSFSAGDSFTVPTDDKNSPKTGYYLFLTDESSLSTSEAAKKNTGTSPIFAVVGGSSVTVTEKTSIPTVDKQILDDTKGKTADKATTDDWKNVGDAWIGQVIDYKLTGTVAANIATFDKYQYEFQDHLSVGLKADENSIVVAINGKKIDASSNYYTATVTDITDASNKKTGQDLKVFFTDLKAAARSVNETLDGNSKVVVTYQAQLTSDAEYTTAGNTNEVKLVYSNDPMSPKGTGTSESKEVTDYVFGFNITKTDPNDSSANLVAGFKVKMIKEGATNEVAKWLKQDGSFTDDEKQAYTFETKGTNNTVSIPGLVAGTYLISESKTPAGYNTIADFEITVTPTYNPTTGKLTNLKVTDTSDMVTTDLDNKVDSTEIPVTIQNKKGSGLPLTGLNGVTFTWIAGGAVLCIGVAHLIRSRKQAEESEQE